MRIAIIGGGISGLYCAHQLYKLYSNKVDVTILESDSRLGGRIHTIKKHGMTYEGGAGRFSGNHRLLMKLIKELELTGHLYEMHSSKLYIKDSTYMKNFDENKYIKTLDVAASKQSKQELKKKTLLMFMREVFSPSEVDDVVYAFGYQSEFEQCDAYNGLLSLKRNFLSTVPHYGMMGGMSRIVEELQKVLEQRGCNILTNWKVSDVDIENMVVHGHDQKSIKTDKIVFCVTKPDLLSFPGLCSKDVNLTSTLDKVATRPLYRVYAKFPVKEKAWFDGIGRVCTNNAIRHMIPIDPRSGLIMLSYTDGMWAEIWRDYASKKDLQKTLMFHVRKLFPTKDIPEPEWIDTIYWPHAAHYPKPNHKKYAQQRSEKYLVCGEVMTTEYNAWVEGALKSVQNALKRIQI